VSGPQGVFSYFHPAVAKRTGFDVIFFDDYLRHSSFQSSGYFQFKQHQGMPVGVGGWNEEGKVSKSIYCFQSLPEK
jgi:hypothetical protein